MRTFQMHLLEADKVFFEGECESLVVPTTVGQYGILAGHSNMISAVVPGVLSYRAPGKEWRPAAVSEGMVKVEGNDILVLVDSAEYPEEIDAKRAQRAADEAKEAILQKRSVREYRRKSTPESCIEIQFKGVKSMIKVGFIDYYLDEWHANNYVHMLHDYSNGEVEAVYAWAEIDSPEGGLTTDAWCEKYGLTRMMTQEELIEKSDVLLVLAPRDPKKHEELANLALRSGKRCYVDKTFAPDHFAAKRMLDLAEQSGTPCWSSSALRFAEEYQAADKTNIKGVNAWGPNGFEDYAIHQLEPIFMMMQAPATEVMHLTNDEVYTGVLRFADGRTATLSGYAKGSPFMMNIARSTENSVLEICSDYFRHFIEALVEFFKNGTIPAPHSETLSIISAWGALMEAEKTPGIWVKVPKD